MKRIFVGMPAFEREFARLGFGDDLRTTIELTLLQDPAAGVLIKETGGIRKLRVAVRGKGKSGGIRVFYFDYVAIEHVFLMAVILKGEQENLDKAQRNTLGSVVQAIKQSQADGKGKKGRRR